MQPATFGQWLKARRRALDLTRAQVASQIGCAEITLGKIERDQRRPSRQIAELLAGALHIPEASRDQFVRFARGDGEPPILDGSKPRLKAGAPLTNLPALLTSFVDRARELAEVCRRLTQPDTRLLTLVGPPGIGKTRLSIQIGQTLLDQFADGVWFVSLATITDPALALTAIARVFDIPEAGVTPLSQRLQAHLRSRELLLILDNFEQVLDAAPHVTDLLKACPKLKALATSREPLNAYGEHIYAMPSLSLPPRDKTLTVEQQGQFDAIKLFVARAEAVQPGFTLNEKNAPVIADICLRLDGVPLAIELAASRLRQFTLTRLRDALNEAPLQALVAAARDVEPRQRTLRNAIQWSYDLLSPAERAAFKRLGVFAGGCTTEAALAVCELPDDAILHALADRSLLKRDANERWTMLEMIREFASEALAQSPGELAPARQRHAEFYARLVYEAALRGDDTTFLPMMDDEQHNGRSALRWLMDHGDALAGPLARGLSWYWEGRGLQTEGLRWLKEVLEAPPALDLFTRARLWYRMSSYSWQRHDFDAALRYAHQALAAFREAGAPSDVANALILIGRIQIEMDDCAQAAETLRQALEIGRRIEDTSNIIGALVQLGEAVLTLGDFAQAEDCFREAYELCQSTHERNSVWLGLACNGMAGAAFIHHDYDRALDYLCEGLIRSLWIAPRLVLLNSLAGVIGTMPRRTTDDVRRAAKIWGAAQALQEKMGWVLAPGRRRQVDATIAEARSRINPKTFDAAWAEGRALSLDEAIQLALE
jgi:predicted ATPase/DNA-binding XRE family transcriptional regulator